MEILFRPITEADLDFLWQLHNAALREYVEKTWGWDEAWQKRDFAAKFDPSEGQIIVVDGIDAGFWWVANAENQNRLISIRLLPEFQKRGIGTRLIRDFVTSSNKPVRLQVLKVNPARALYERLGFEIVDETPTHYKMIRKV